MATDNSPKSLLDRFRHLNAEEKSEFIRLLRREVLVGNFELTSREWEDFGLSGLTEEWDRPENDFWDEEFQRQNQS
jgi:hypothetical protein